MADDVLDLGGDPEVIGKNAFADLRDGKLTWPLIMACEERPALEESLKEVARAPETLTPEGVRALREQLLETQCLEKTRLKAQEFAQAAEAALEKLPASAATDALKAVVSLAVNRCM